MKKRKLNRLSLNKKVISGFGKNGLKGGQGDLTLVPCPITDPPPSGINPTMSYKDPCITPPPPVC